MSPSESTSYKLTAENNEGDVAFMVLTVSVESADPLPQINHFSANSDTINQGESVVLSWNTSNSRSVAIEPLGKVQPKGSIRAAPTKTTTYILTAKNSEGKSVSEKFRVNVVAKPVEEIRPVTHPPRIKFFKTNANNLEKGSPFILSWETQDADEVQITEIGSVIQSGSKSLNATDTKTYTLTATNKEGEKTQSTLTITVVDKTDIEIEKPKIKYKDYTPVIPEAVRRQLEKKE